MLPWHEIHEQITEYAAKRLEHQAVVSKRLQQQTELFNKELGDKWQTWKERIEQSNQKHLIPDFDEPPTKTYPVPELPMHPLVISSDGSQLIPNRHEAVPLALINISRIRLDYHNYESEQILDSITTVLSLEDFDTIDKDDRTIPFDDLIGDRRTIDEIGQLARLAERSKEIVEQSGQPALLLLDGSLILWRLAGRAMQEYEKKITQEYVESLMRIQELRFPIAGYISQSGGREIVQMLEWIERESGNRPKNMPLSYTDKSLTDVMIFGRVLKKGQRSIVFQSRSKILDEYKKHGPGQDICYFFLHVDREIAKVEIPKWVADFPDLVDQAAAICLQQAELGQGYPIAVSQAHEFAVIRGQDRQTFQSIVEQELVRHGIETGVSPKLASKNQPVY